MDWDHGRYAAFSDLRLRPALDLLARVPLQSPTSVVDLGCGGGAAAAALRARFPEARLIGVDPSPAMREAAGKNEAYDAVSAGDAASFAAQRGATADLVFANASLHWAADHAALFPALLSRLSPGGALAVQMPRQFAEPSHVLLWRIAHAMYPERFAKAPLEPPVAPPEAYVALLSPIASLDVWETVYQQRLAPVEGGLHPVAGFTRSTAARPFLEQMAPEEQRDFLTAYAEALAEPYPLLADGSAWLPFRRLFLVARQ